MTVKPPFAAADPDRRLQSPGSRCESPLILRFVAAVIIGAALVTSGLQPAIELLNAGRIISVPKWWVFMNFLALSALVISAFALRRRDRRLLTIVWLVFAACVLVSLVQGIEGFHVIPTEVP